MNAGFILVFLVICQNLPKMALKYSGKFKIKYVCSLFSSLNRNPLIRVKTTTRRVITEGHIYL